MKRLAVLTVLLTMLACAAPQAGTSRNTAQPGHGAISLTIQPNPIVARKASGDNYEFPFDAIVRESGGHAVTISRVSLDVYAVAGLKVGSESYDAARIGQLGYSTTVPANGELRYHFTPAKSVGDDRLFGSVYGEVRVEGTDDTGTPTSASTTVTVSR